MNHIPFFSVIIPIYNGQNYLERCLDSIVSQSFVNFECILIDDGSMDGSYLIGKTYSEKDIRIMIYHQKNCGVSIARKNGLELAKGEYVSFVDCDDYLNSDHYEKCYKVLCENEPEMIQFGFILRNNNSRIVKKAIPVFSGSFIDMFIKYEGCMSSLWSKIVKRSIFFDKHIQFPESVIMNEDMYVSFCLYSCVRKIIYSGDILYNYMINSNSCVQNHSEKHIESMLIIADKLEQFCMEHDIKNGSNYAEFRKYMAISLYITDIKLINFEKWRRSTSLEQIKNNKKNTSCLIYFYSLLVWHRFDILAFIICKIYSIFRKLFY